ncbi:hypothetical protein [Mucilaginibacter phyllosphaerae]
MENEKKVLIANELRLTDLSGKVRAMLTANENGADLIFCDKEGKNQLKITSSDAGLAAISIYDKTGLEKIGISLDDKGTHVHLAGPDKQESYLFLKNSGACGLVLTDSDGNRRLEAKVGPDAEPDITIYPKNGDPKKL